MTSQPALLPGVGSSRVGRGGRHLFLVLVSSQQPNGGASFLLMPLVPSLPVPTMVSSTVLLGEGQGLVS